MKVAVLSGKGGAGKTLVAVNLAAASTSSIYIDCDVEEPNGNLFLKAQNLKIEDVAVKIPKVNLDLCDGCRKCVEFCKFNALAYIKNKLIIFEEICHSCGGCVLVCPQKALTEKEKVIGRIEKGKSKQVDVCTGILNVGEASGVPVINKILSTSKSKQDKLTIIDCPPGSACVVMESIKDADYCVLVAEPTLFGRHNLNMVYELVKLFNKQCGVVLNKCLNEENPSEEFCKENDLKILTRIPFDKELGKLNSDAKIAVYQDEKYKEIFSGLLKIIAMEVNNETVINP